MLIWLHKVVSDKFESQIRASSIRRQQFSQIVKTFMGKDLQLLRDVDTRWSSALLMIERALILEEVTTSEAPCHATTGAMSRALSPTFQANAVVGALTQAPT